MDGDKRTEEGKKREEATCPGHSARTHGHIIPALLLLKELVKQSIRVTFIGYKADIDRLISKDVELNTKELLQFVGLPRASVGTENPREAAHLLWKSFKEVNMLEQLSVGGGPTSISSDMFNYWSTDLALQLQILKYVLLTSGAALTRFFQGFEDLIIQGTLRVNADHSQIEKFDGLVRFPGLPALRYHELNPMFQRFPLLFNQYAREVMTVSGILINTFYEVEASVVDSLRTLSTIRVTELALGLERSKHRLLWVLPRHSVSALYGVRDMDPEKAAPDVLPLGFEEGVAEHGYVVKGWVPQVQVLSHRSTGGFLTHCGWKSVLEAVSTGVTMLTWPISADQHLNCRLLVDQLKVASKVKKAAHGIVEQREVERVVRLFMEEERLAMKGRMDLLKQQAAAAKGSWWVF